MDRIFFFFWVVGVGDPGKDRENEDGAKASLRGINESRRQKGQLGIHTDCLL